MKKGKTLEVREGKKQVAVYYRTAERLELEVLGSPKIRV